MHSGPWNVGQGGREGGQKVVDLDAPTSHLCFQGSKMPSAGRSVEKCCVLWWVVKASSCCSEIEAQGAAWKWSVRSRLFGFAPPTPHRNPLTSPARCDSRDSRLPSPPRCFRSIHPFLVARGALVRTRLDRSRPRVIPPVAPSATATTAPGASRTSPSPTLPFLRSRMPEAPCLLPMPSSH